MRPARPPRPAAPAELDDRDVRDTRRSAAPATRHPRVRRAEHDRAAPGGAAQGAGPRVRAGLRGPRPRLPPPGATSRSRSASTPRSSELLASLGTTVHLLEAEIDSPDLLYAFDPLLITDRGAIPLRPGQAEPADRARSRSRAGRSPAASRRSGGSRRPARSRAATRSGSGRTCSSSGGRCGRTRPGPTSSPRSWAATSGSSTCRTGAATPTSSTSCPLIHPIADDLAVVVPAAAAGRAVAAPPGPGLPAASRSPRTRPTPVATTCWSSGPAS